MHRGNALQHGYQTGAAAITDKHHTQAGAPDKACTAHRTACCFPVDKALIDWEHCAQRLKGCLTMLLLTAAACAGAWQSPVGLPASKQNTRPCMPCQQHVVLDVLMQHRVGVCCVCAAVVMQHECFQNKQNCELPCGHAACTHNQVLLWAVSLVPKSSAVQHPSVPRTYPCVAKAL